MCLILFAREAHPDYELILAANRDELYDRPAAPAGWWPDHPDLLAGRDLEQMGSWLGITRGGRWAAVTNYREPARSRRPGGDRSDPPSRGGLVRAFLTGRDTPSAYLKELERGGGGYNGYNLLFGSRGLVAYHSNRGTAALEVPKGVHGLSNHLLDTPWPKVVRGREGLASIIEGGSSISVEALFDLLADREPAPDAQLPDTGVGIALERLLSPIFIEGEGYGTRCSTVLLIRRDGLVSFEERDLRGDERRRFEFSIG